MPEGEESSVGQVAWTASAGLGQEYRWDFDSDGEWDTEWAEESDVRHDYANHRRQDPEDRSGAEIAALVGIFETPADNFGPYEHVAEQGGGPVDLEMPNVIPDALWADQNSVPIDGFDRFVYDLFGPQLPSMQMATVQRFDGHVPEDSVPDANERGERLAVLSFAIYPLSIEGQPEPAATWGPVEREVQLSVDGTFSVLLGVDEPLLPSHLPVAIEQHEDGAEERINRGVVRYGDESSEVDFAPAMGMLVHIHDAAIRDDEVRDGIVLLSPGQSLQIGNEMRLNVAVQVRATVEARNAFGNVTSSSEVVTVRVAAGGGARAEVTR